VEDRKNNIGFLRLLFACLVIAGHSSEILDGNRSREPLTMVFHTMSLGELAVDGFFLLSGFLIAKSMVNSRTLRRFLLRRVLRIYPAFVVAYLLSVFVLGPRVGAQPWLQMRETLYNLVTLQPPPEYPGQLLGVHYPGLNVSMWTILYEFRCYLLVGALGALGLLERRRFVLGLTAAAAFFAFIGTFPGAGMRIDALNDRAAGLIGNMAFDVLMGPALASTIRFTAVFLTGSCFYLFRKEIGARLSGTAAVAAGLLAAVCLYRDPHFAELGLTAFGAVSLFWIAFRAPLGPLRKINGGWDISYGVYLFGWPIAMYFRWMRPSISPWGLTASTLAVALLFGAASWWGLERWTKDLLPPASPY
jgi:peptidoglycan/LPS O-acetylase OafA/YrhL